MSCWRYGNSGRVKVGLYGLEIVKRKKKTGPKLEQNLGSSTILNSPTENSEKEPIVKPEIVKESKSQIVKLDWHCLSK